MSESSRVETNINKKKNYHNTLWKTYYYFGQYDYQASTLLHSVLSEHLSNKIHFSMQDCFARREENGKIYYGTFSKE